ncbi:MAG: peptide deformylase [Gammaproteobacteria bacterium]
MAQRRILEYPDPRLNQQSQPVTLFDDALSQLIDDLFDTLYATSGIGLCAPQIGELQQVLVMDLSEDHSERQVFINPRLLSTATPCMVEESCLSVPDYVSVVRRFADASVSACDRDGNTFRRELSGMSAVCLQHEMDHLDGKLFVERLPLLRRMYFNVTAAGRLRRAANA